MSAAGTPSDTSTFRPDIEGLRAVAVLLVLAYHARVPGWAGGYIGVDVFFVVSGFLITSLILREIASTGRVALTTFYARRARRLLPASLVVIAVTVLASAIVLPPLRATDVAVDGAAAALYVSNIRFVLQATDYLQSELDPSPLLHFWSLGVEEQFYLVWPALLMLAAGRGANIRRVALAVGVVAVASFLLNLAWTSTDAPLAFFLLPARAWELALGAGIALAATRLARIPASFGNAGVAVGLGFILIGALAFDSFTVFPGWAVLLPVVGSGLVIAGGLRRPLGPLSRLLAIPPMQWIGGISYSLYLWHWPLLVLPAAALGGAFPWYLRLSMVGVAIVLAWASKRWIEDPIRHGRMARLPSARSLGIAGTASVLVAVGALGIGRVATPPDAVAFSGEVVLPLPSTTPMPSTPSPQSSAEPTLAPSRPPTPSGPVPSDLVPPLSQVRQDEAIIYRDGCHGPIQAELPPAACVYGNRAGETTVFLLGDSHAAHWFPALERLARESDWRLIALTKSTCPAIDIPLYSDKYKREFTECVSWRTEVERRIAEERPAMVVLAASRNNFLLIDGESVLSEEREDLWQAAMERTIARLSKSAEHVVVLGDTPNPKGDPAVCISDNLDDALACATPSSEAVSLPRLATERAASEATGATFIDPTDWLCPTDPCPAIIGNVLVYRDGHHMTSIFAAALAPHLRPLLPDLGG